MEDGIHALFVPTGVEVDLGDFAGSCISTFRSGTDKTIKVLDSVVKYSLRDEHGWSFEISSSFVGEVVVMVSGGNSEQYFEKLAGTNPWIQMVFIFDPDSSRSSLILYQNGYYVIHPCRVL